MNFCSYLKLMYFVYSLCLSYDIDLYVAEFQKRGLPHCHFLFWLCHNEKLSEPSQIDKFISAEIPNPEKKSRRI